MMRDTNHRAERLPNLIVPGAAKAGTTTVYHYLAQHPKIYLPRTKEPNFFSNDVAWEGGVDTYIANHFAEAAAFPVRAEATPHYLFYEKAARRIAEVLPRTHQRFLVVLRDPVERAYSLYWNMVHEGHETLSFEAALEAEPGRQGTEAIERIGGIRWQYFASGLYASQIERWLQFFPTDAFMFVLTEDLRGNRMQVVNRIFSLLGLEPLDRIEAVRSNKAALPRSRLLQRFLRHPNRARTTLGKLLPSRLKLSVAGSLLRINRRPFEYPPMNPDTKKALRERFAPDVERLQTLIRRDLSAWLPDGIGVDPSSER